MFLTSLCRTYGAHNSLTTLPTALPWAKLPVRLTARGPTTVGDFWLSDYGDDVRSRRFRRYLSPVRPVQRPVLDCFRDVLALDLRAALHVGNRPRDFQYPVMRTRA